MPNGGSDCCGTCWFNARNKGEAGYSHADDPEPKFCTIRGLAIEHPFWTYCTNHPHHRPNSDPIPIGPVFIHVDGDSRKEWQPSPDTEEVRQHLLDLASSIQEQPVEEYPSGGMYVLRRDGCVAVGPVPRGTGGWRAAEDRYLFA